MIKSLCALALFTFVFCHILVAADLSAQVTYVSASAIYVSAGNAQGVHVGDSVRVVRDAKTIAVLLASFVADSSTSCSLPVGTPAIRVYDAVVIGIHAVAPMTVKKDSVAAIESTAPIAAPKPAVRVCKNRVTGRIGASYLMQSDHGTLDFDFMQPALNVRLNIDNLLDTKHTLSLLMNGRRTMRVHELSSATRSQWTGRVFELALTDNDPVSALHYAAGRILSGQLRGIGSFDGVQGNYRLHSRVSVGAVAGTIPDVQTSEPSSLQTQYGAYATYESKDNERQLSGTFGLIGQYHRGSVSREFLYEQLNLAPDTRFYLWQSGEVNVNRGWKRHGGASAVELANILFNAGWEPHSNVNVNVSVDDRINYRTWENRATPDSLFDNSRRQGVNMSDTWRVFKIVRLSAGGGLAWRDATGRSARSENLGAMVLNAPLRGSTVSVNWSGFDNAFVKGGQPSVSLTQQVGSRILFSAQAGQSSYNYQTGGRIKNSWWKLQTDAYFARALYGSMYYESYQGDTPDTQRLFVELGMRL